MIFRVSGGDSPSVSMEIPLSLSLPLCVAHLLSASPRHRDSKKEKGRRQEEKKIRGYTLLSSLILKNKI